MRYLSFLAAVLASAPAYAQFTDTIQLSPGFAVRWQAPRPYTTVIVGNPDVADVIQSQTNRQLIITKKPVRSTPSSGHSQFGRHYRTERRHYQFRATGCEWRAGRKRADYQSYWIAI